MKKVDYIIGQPVVNWTEFEVAAMGTTENLQYPVIDEFSYDWPE